MNRAFHQCSAAVRSVTAPARSNRSTMSSVYRVKPYRACTYGRFHAGSSRVAR